LGRVWAETFSDLVLTALKERGTTAARIAHFLSVDPRIAMAMVAVVLAAVGVTLASLLQTPTYEATAQVWVDQDQGEQQTNLAESTKGLQTIILMMIHTIDSRPVAQKALRRLELDTSPAELLNNLTIEQVESTSFIVLTYQGNDPVQAAQIVNTVCEVSSELVYERSARSPGSQLTANVYEEAIVPESPVSPKPLRNGLLTLVIGLVLCAGLALALPVVGASEAEGIKEKELLEALDRRGKLTAAGAVLETSLSVGEAMRMLRSLAAKGHLQVRVEHGRLLYAQWEREV
jgi:capsular polysaccharide biosynthesis protein